MVSTTNNDVAHATEVLKSIPDFIKAITDILQTPSGLVVVVFLLLWFVVNRDLTHLYSLFEYKEDKRLLRLEKYISEPDKASPNTLKVAKEQRDTYYFKVSTNGIYAEKELRDSLIKLHETTSASISWTTIRRAISYIELDANREVFVREVRLFDIVSLYYNRFVAFVFGLLSVGSLILLILSSAPTFMATIKMVLLATVFGCGVLIVLFQNLPHSSAKKIKSEIKALEAEKEVLPSV
ncbi:hypothetical protein [Vibrio sp. 10N.222.52.C12]|uniref:hypothetical protein n=1 Tax=Vibrio sp. 10N.222.52.C12 TaxID=3229630 RepID=UPI0035535EEE